MDADKVNESMELYATGKYSLQDLGKMYGYTPSGMYYAMKKAGCVFTRKFKHPMSDKERARRGLINKGKKLTDEQKRAISERNSCNYNGLNGYGHTKNHKSGYVLAYAPKHPNAHADGYIMLHTVVMEQHIGRYLRPNEEVHHINHNRADNRIENLQLMDKHEHRAMHMKERHEKRRNDISIAS